MEPFGALLEARDGWRRLTTSIGTSRPVLSFVSRKTVDRRCSRNDVGHSNGGTSGCYLGDEKQVQIGPEARGQLDASRTSTSATPMPRCCLGAKYRFADYFTIGAAAGPRHRRGHRNPRRSRDRHVRCFSDGRAVETRISDGDEVPDRSDACPDQPGVAEQRSGDQSGCPVAVQPKRRPMQIATAFRSCSRTPVPASAESPMPTLKKNGCPGDSDGDGLDDSKDACPTVKP